MELTNFLIWLIAIAVIIGVGLGTMVWAYLGAGSTNVLFPAPISSSAAKAAISELAEAYQQGYHAFESGKYRQAIIYFNQAIQLNPSLAEAYHNRGLAFANLRQDNEAVANLMQAGDWYAQQGNESAIIEVKANLNQIKASKSTIS